MKTYFIALVIIGLLFSETSSGANYNDKVVTDFINLIVSDGKVSLKDYVNFVGHHYDDEFDFEIMKCRANGWNPYSDRCSSLNHIYYPRANSFFMEWVKERFATSGQDYEIISSVFVKHTANADEFWLIEVLIGEYIFVLERYTPRSVTGELVLLDSAYKKDDNSIRYSMILPSSCHRDIYTGTYDFKVNDEIQATLDIPTYTIKNRIGKGSIFGRYTPMPIEINWVYLAPDFIRIESKNNEENNYLSNTLRKLAETMDNADLTPFDSRLDFGLYADCKYGVINRMYFYNNKDIFFFERKTMMPDIIKDPQILLYNAVQEGNIAEVLRLLKAGVDIDAKIHGYTILTLASFRGYTEIVQVLIDAGADVNADSGTALKIAEREGHIAVILLLKNARVE